MTKYRIYNLETGVVFGDYTGDTEQEALDAYARDAGYASYAESCDVVPVKPGEIVAEAMTKYRIYNTISGVILGDYDGGCEDDALDAMARDAGYADYAESCDVVPVKPGEIVAEELSFQYEYEGKLIDRAAVDELIAEHGLGVIMFSAPRIQGAFQQVSVQPPTENPTPVRSWDQIDAENRRCASIPWPGSHEVIS